MPRCFECEDVIQVAGFCSDCMDKNRSRFEISDTLAKLMDWEKHTGGKGYSAGVPFWGPQKGPWIQFSPSTSWEDLGTVIEWREAQGQPLYILGSKSDRSIQFGDLDPFVSTYGVDLRWQIAVAAIGDKELMP